jgi:hypothetical protein
MANGVRDGSIAHLATPPQYQSIHQASHDANHPFSAMREAEGHQEKSEMKRRQ